MSKAEERFSPEDVTRFLSYDADTGFLTWRPRAVGMSVCGRTIDSRFVPHFNKTCAGRRAEHLGSHGYLNVNLFRTSFRAHRVAWAIRFGKWPSKHLDHINGVRTDNRLCNLRPACPAVNSKNLKRYKNNTSGVHGVYFSKRRGKWAAYIRSENKPHHLGTFEKFEDAVAARAAAEKLYGFHPNHGR